MMFNSNSARDVEDFVYRPRSSSRSHGHSPRHPDNSNNSTTNTASLYTCHITIDVSSLVTTTDISNNNNNNNNGEESHQHHHHSNKSKFSLHFPPFISHHSSSHHHSSSSSSSSSISNKFKFIMYPNMSFVEHHVNEYVYHCKYETLFRNSPFLISWTTHATHNNSNNNNSNNNSNNNTSIMTCVPMRMQTHEPLEIPMHKWCTNEGRFEFQSKRDNNSPCVSIKVDWTRKQNRELIAYYTFNEIACANLCLYALDHSGKGNHALLKNLNTDNPVLTYGVKGKGMLFSGFNYLICEKNPLRGLSEFTISLWFKYTKGHETDDTIILSCVKSVDDLDTEDLVPSVSTIIDQEKKSVRHMSGDEIFFNEMFYGPKAKSLLTQEEKSIESQMKASLHSLYSSSSSSSSSPSFLSSIPGEGKKRSSWSAKMMHMRRSTLSNNIEIGFKIGTVKNFFSDSDGNSLILTKRSRNQKRKEYDSIFGSVLHKNLSDSDHVTPEQLEMQFTASKDQMNDDQDEDVEIEEDDHRDDFERPDFFHKDDFNHLVITYSGDRLKEYINGTCTDDKRATFGLLGDGVKLVIGAMTEGFEFSGFRGTIDEVMMFNYALSSQEVRGLYDLDNCATYR